MNQFVDGRRKRIEARSAQPQSVAVSALSSKAEGLPGVPLRAAPDSRAGASESGPAEAPLLAASPKSACGPRIPSPPLR
jgi:hypothetical protein